MHTVQVNRNVNRFSHMPSPQSMYDIQQIKPEPHGGQMMDSDDDSCTDDDSPKKRRDLLTRRPSYRKILNDLGGGEIGNICNFLPMLESLIDGLYATRRNYSIDFTGRTRGTARITHDY